MYYVYIMSNWNNKVVYTGCTGNLPARMYHHKNKLVDGFTKKYNTDKLVYFEATEEKWAALEREKQIKRWRRDKKNNLINRMNPNWNDLTDTLI